MFEDLKDIRETAKCRKKQRYAKNSWSFYRLQKMVEYKAQKVGVPIVYVASQYTSQRCSHCGHIDKNSRKGKLFQCKSCRIVEDADANAGFNIAYLHQEGIPQFNKDRDLLKWSTDAPQGEIL